MIRVLSSRTEVDDALRALRAEGLPVHVTPQKNWDHVLIQRLIRGKDPGIRILDVGSGDGHTLEFLHGLGFRNLEGIDLTIPRRRRLLRLLRLVGRRGTVATDWIRRGDMCATGLPAASVDLVTSVSVIEHGVDKRAFLAECARILRPGGLLFVSTDYWDEVEPAGDGEQRLFDRDWSIQDRRAVEEILSLAGEAGLVPLEDAEIPASGERTVRYLGREYTFIAVVLTRDRTGPGGHEATAPEDAP